MPGLLLVWLMREKIKLLDQPRPEARLEQETSDESVYRSRGDGHSE